MKYRDKERRIDYLMYNEAFTTRTYNQYTNLVETQYHIPQECRELCLSLGYRNSEINERVEDIQEFKRDNKRPYSLTYSHYRRRWYNHKTRHRYYADKVKRYALDKPPHIRPFKMKVGYSEEYLKKLKEKKDKKEEIKPLRMHKKAKISKVHQLLKIKNTTHE